MTFLRLSSLFLGLSFFALGACSSTGSEGPGTMTASGGATSPGGGTGGEVGSGGAVGTGGDTPVGTGGAATGGTSTVVDDGSGLDSVYSSFFPIGVALQQNELDADATLIAENFNHLTAGNAMKGSSIHPAEDTWNTAEADYLADFARDHGWKMTGHTFVWHRQQPSWMFADLTPGDATSVETLKVRLKAHIEYMVARYGDVVDNWDVVNEIVTGNNVGNYRTADNSWYNIFQSFDYVYWAFRYTHDALEAQAPGSSAGKLYYNDFNCYQHATGILGLVDFIENHPEGGVTVDGIGMQAHVRADWPSASEVETTIEQFISAGLKVKISELDVSVYNDYPAPDYSFVAAAEVPFNATIDAEIAAKYQALFTMFRSHATNITSVTVWGFRDEDSWLNSEPVANRKNYPLLFNASGPKAAFDAIQQF